jgi:Cof subfamily protein (haloacid dehalogenase superfamily)
MNYKMLVLDMDDTLLTDAHTISLRNKEMIMKAQAKGVYVVLASGRPTPAMLSFAEDLALANYDSYILSYNGAIITEMKTQKILFEQSITAADIHELYDFSKEHNVHIITYVDGDIIAETQSEYIDYEAKLTGMPLRQVTDFKEAVSVSAVKCLMLEEPTHLKLVQAKLEAAMPHKSISMSKPFFLEIMQQGIDKASSLARLAALLSIDASEIIAVGNASNDLSMIEYAGLGVWVDNVTPELRHIADVIVASNNNDGVAEVIERFILNEC